MSAHEIATYVQEACMSPLETAKHVQQKLCLLEIHPHMQQASMPGPHSVSHYKVFPQIYVKQVFATV